MAIDWDQIYSASQDKRDRFRSDLLSRARTIQRSGWDAYQYRWSTGETIAVAWLLDADDVLAEMGETRRDVLHRWAYDLFGQTGGAADKADDFARTAAWFTDTRADLG